MKKQRSVFVTILLISVYTCTAFGGAGEVMVAAKRGVGTTSLQGFNLLWGAQGAAQRQIGREMVLKNEVAFFNKGDRFIQLETGGHFIGGYWFKVRHFPLRDRDIPIYVRNGDVVYEPIK
ncbi:MAG: hypothetical protein WBG50_10090 [Desulfomonilaceae bacterium]